MKKKTNTLEQLNMGVFGVFEMKCGTVLCAAFSNVYLTIFCDHNLTF